MRALFIEHDHISLGGPIWRSLEKHGYEIERFLIVPQANYDSPNITTTFPNFNEYDLLVPMGATEIAKTALATQAFVMGRTLALQFHPEVDPQVLEAWLSRESGCVEITGEGVDLTQLRAQTLQQEAGSNLRAAELIDAFLRRVATAPLLQV